MDNQSDPSRKSTEKKPTPLGNQILLYVLAVGIGTWVIVMLYSSRATVRLTYGEFEDLIRQSADSPHKTDGYIEVPVSPSTKEKRRFRNPTDLVVGDREITGKLKVDPKEAKAGKEKKREISGEVRFSVYKQPEMAKEVLDLFKDNNFKKIVILGDSFTIAEEMPERDTFAIQLEHILNKKLLYKIL